jgi:hypothetical protein
VTFSEPVRAKKWTAAAKNAIANLSRKQIPKSFESVHPSKLHSAKTDILKRTLFLPQNSTTEAKYASVVRALSLPSTNPLSV